MDSDMDRRKSQKRLKAGRKALPTDDQAAIFLLEPGKCALRLKAWHHFVDRSATIFLGFPDALRYLCPDTPLPELLPKRFRIIAFICGDDLEAFAGATTFAGADLHGIKQRHHLCPLVPIGRRGPVAQGHAAPLVEAVDEDPLAFP